MPTRVIGVRTSLAELDRDVMRTIEREIRRRTLAALADVKLATPVDTGLARNSWRYNQIRNEVLNPVNYIQYLNMGTSMQAASNFIESSFLRYFDEVIVEVYDDPNAPG